MNKAQKLVNQIDMHYGFDCSSLTDVELQNLIVVLKQLKELNRDDVISPSELEMDSYIDEDEDFGEYEEESLELDF